jgi:hypothetical protein
MCRTKLQIMSARRRAEAANSAVAFTQREAKFAATVKLAPVRIAKSHVSLRRGNEGRPASVPLLLEDWTMWALFANGKQVSRAFQTEKEAWHLARKSSLVDGGRLPNGFEIRQIAERTHAA